MGDCMSKVRIYGDTSGYIDVAAPDTADNSTLDLSTVAKTTGDQTFGGDVAILNSDGSSGNLKIGGSNAGLGLTIGYDQSSSTTASITANPTYVNSNAKLRLGVQGDARPDGLVIDGLGRVTMPYQPSFHARGAQTRQTGTFDSWATVHHNNGNHFNTSNGTFTAPVDGYYQCGATLLGTSMSVGQWLGIAVRINGVTLGQTAYQTASTTNDTSSTVSCVVYASAGDGLTLYAANQSSNYNYYSFSIHLVG